MKTLASACTPIEGFLRDYGVTHVELIEEFELAKIDVKASQNNQARTTKLNTETAESYAVVLQQRGAVFPPLIVTYKRGKWVLADGNHRLAAMLALGITHYPVYVIKAIPSVIDRVTMDANSMNGRPRTDSENISLIESYHALGDTVTQIALSVGASENFVKKVLLINEVRARVAQPKHIESLGDTNLRHLNRLRDDEALNAMAEAVYDLATEGVTIKTDVMNDIVKKVNSARSLDRRLEAVKEWKDEMSVAARVKKERGPRTHTDRRTLTNAIGRLDKVNVNDVIRSIASDPIECNRLREKVAQSAIHLMELEDALTRTYTEMVNAGMAEVPELDTTDSTASPEKAAA